jgi:hypothetical protein
MRIGPTRVKIGKTVLYPTDKLEWDQKNNMVTLRSVNSTQDAGHDAA